MPRRIWGSSRVARWCGRALVVGCLDAGVQLEVLCWRGRTAAQLLSCNTATPCRPPAPAVTCRLQDILKKEDGVYIKFAMGSMLNMRYQVGGVPKCELLLRSAQFAPISIITAACPVHTRPASKLGFCCCPADGCLPSCVQVRVGMLAAGNFGVPQGRWRCFMWAAAPGQQLPAIPKPTHNCVHFQASCGQGAGGRVRGRGQGACQA